MLTICHVWLLVIRTQHYSYINKTSGLVVEASCDSRSTWRSAEKDDATKGKKAMIRELKCVSQQNLTQMQTHGPFTTMSA
jgi:hypothetical protein